MTGVTVGTDSQAASPVDGPTDDYESWNGELYGGLHKGKAVLYVDDLWVH